MLAEEEKERCVWRMSSVFAFPREALWARIRKATPFSRNQVPLWGEVPEYQTRIFLADKPFGAYLADKPFVWGTVGPMLPENALEFAGQSYLQ